MRQRYNKNKALADIQPVWSDIIRHRKDTAKIMKCNADYEAIWCGKELGSSLVNINEILKTPMEEDVLVMVDGIWCQNHRKWLYYYVDLGGIGYMYI